MPRPSLLDYASQPQNATEPAASKQLPKSRRATPEEIIQTSFRLPRSRWKRLQELSIDERSSAQSIIVRALEREFAALGLKF